MTRSENGMTLDEISAAEATYQIPDEIVRIAIRRAAPRGQIMLGRVLAHLAHQSHLECRTRWSRWPDVARRYADVDA